MSKEKKVTIGDIKRLVESWCETCKLNNRDIFEVPVYIMESWHKYPIHNGAISFGENFEATFRYYKDDEIIKVAPDSRPEVGEYWTSRGPSDFDCSGFVVSKLAGERLRRLVRYVLEKDDTESWLDYRDFEPEWIQFKFSAEEFNVENLDILARANNNIVTEEILRRCKLENK